MRFALAAAAAGMLASAGEAEAQSATFELNGVSAGERDGAELALGARFAAGPLRVTPSIGLLMYQGENDRYREETIAGGSTICRDQSNGQFADDEKCNNTDFAGFGRIDAALAFRWGEFGGGVRLSDDASQAYGRVAVYLGDTWALQAFAGDDFVGAGFVWGRLRESQRASQSTRWSEVR